MQEKDLIEKSRQGDEEAFATLFALYREKIFHHILAIVKEEEAAKDLLQETFLHAYQHLPGFKEESSFYTWVYRIAHNLSLNYLKKRGRRREEELKEELVAAPAFKDETLTKDILLAITTLTPKLRIVYELCEIEGLSQKEVAAKLAIPEGTVRSRLHHARKEIAAYFSTSSQRLRKER